MKIEALNKLSMLLIFMLISSTSFCQEKKDLQLVQKIKKVNLLKPGYEYETPIGKTTTVGCAGELGVWGAYGNTREFVMISDVINSQNRVSYYFDLVPSANIYSRWYYNLKKRTAKGKKTANNSATYLTAGITLASPLLRLAEEYGKPFESAFYTGIYAGWGLRRTIGSHLTLDIGLRIQPTFENFKEGAVFWIPSLRLGYAIGKRK